jgi:hypothetical protein
MPKTQGERRTADARCTSKPGLPRPAVMVAHGSMASSCSFRRTRSQLAMISSRRRRAHSRTNCRARGSRAVREHIHRDRGRPRETDIRKWIIEWNKNPKPFDHRRNPRITRRLLPTNQRLRTLVASATLAAAVLALLPRIYQWNEHATEARKLPSEYRHLYGDILELQGEADGKGFDQAKVAVLRSKLEALKERRQNIDAPVPD